MATIIYALCDPDLQIPVIRYIGKTVNMRRRFRDHCHQSVKEKTHLGNWLKSLKARKVDPVLLTLTEVPDEIGSAAEVLYIRLAKEGGMDLVNATDGGDGVTMTPEIREKIGAAQLGEKNHMFGKTGSYSPLFGQKHTEERRAKNSASQRSRIKSLEDIEKQSAVNRGRKKLGSSSAYVGVSWCRRLQKWKATIKKVYLGYFTSEVDAAKAYDAAALRLFGPTAKLNFP